MMRQTEVFQPHLLTFGMPDIENHKLVYSSRVPETQARQQRLLKKWNHQREILHSRLKWEQDFQKKWQLQKLSELVDYAYNCIPFYKRLYSTVGFRTGDIVTWEDFHALPMINKDHLINSYPHEIVLPGIVPEHCYGARTSGSSGKSVTVLCDDNTSELWILELFRQYETMMQQELQPQDKIYNIYHSTLAFTSLNGDYPIFSVSSDCPVSSLAKHIELLKPTVISTFPSVLKKLTDFCGDLKPFGVRAICTNSESSSRGERSQYAAHFNVPVCDEYSSEELPMIASECVHGNYHVLEDRTYVEIIDQNDEGTGDIVGTDLSNIYMPIIRYQQGDQGSWGKHSSVCSCQNKFRYFDKFQGRSDQTLFSKIKGEISALDIINICDQFLVPQESKIKEFRIVQKNKETITVLFVSDVLLKSEYPHFVFFQKKLQQLFGFDIKINFEQVEKIPALKSFKRKMIINQIEK